MRKQPKKRGATYQPDDCCGDDATDLSALVDCYRAHHHALREMLADFRELSLADAIRFGAGGIKPKDTNCPKRMYEHQLHVGRKRCAKAADLLLLQEDKIYNCGSFDELIKIVRDHARQELRFRSDRFNSLAVYDTAVRIGANRNKLPKLLYLPADTKIGAKNLGFNTSKSYLEIDELPDEFRQLQSPPLGDDLLSVYVADFLCIYKVDLLRLRQNSRRD